MNSLALAITECQSFRKYLIQQGKVTTMPPHLEENPREYAAVIYGQDAPPITKPTMSQLSKKQQ